MEGVLAFLGSACKGPSGSIPPTRPRVHVGFTRSNTGTSKKANP